MFNPLAQSLANLAFILDWHQKRIAYRTHAVALDSDHCVVTL